MRRSAVCRSPPEQMRAFPKTPSPGAIGLCCGFAPWSIAHCRLRSTHLKQLLLNMRSGEIENLFGCLKRRGFAQSSPTDAERLEQAASSVLTPKAHRTGRMVSPTQALEVMNHPP